MFGNSNRISAKGALMKYTSKRDGSERYYRLKITVGTIKTEEELLIYNDGTHEVYLKTIKDFQKMCDTYQFLKDKNEEPPILFARFSKVLKGNASDNWGDLMADNTNRKVSTFCKLIDMMTAAILGKHAYRNQVRYLKTTPKPDSITLSVWIQRIKNINSHLNILHMLENGKLDELALIEDVILENIPAQWRSYYRLCGRDKIDKLSEAKETLKLIKEESGNLGGKASSESYNKKSGKDTKIEKKPETNKKGFSKGNKTDITVKNTCQIPNHKGHSW